jgi:hypothetical protein
MVLFSRALISVNARNLKNLKEELKGDGGIKIWSLSKF